MKILIVEPFFIGSHKTWAEGYKKYRVEVKVILIIEIEFIYIFRCKEIKNQNKNKKFKISSKWRSVIYQIGLRVQHILLVYLLLFSYHKLLFAFEELLRTKTLACHGLELSREGEPLTISLFT